MSTCNQKDLACKAPSFEPRLNSGSLAAIDSVFRYNQPTEVQLEAIEEIRKKAKELAIAIKVNAPPSADTSAAIRKVREAMMTANAAIVLEGASI